MAGEENQHELLEVIDDLTKFFLIKIPNQDCLMNSLIRNEIPLTENSSNIFEQTFRLQREEISLVLFVTIQGSEQLYGVCQVQLPRQVEEVTEDWKQYWQGKFKSTIKVSWLIPDCAMPLAKINQFLQPVLNKKSSDMMVELALNPDDQYGRSSGNLSAGAELFNQRQSKNLIEVPHDAGVQISKSYVNWQKQKLSETDHLVIFKNQLIQWQ